MMRSGEIRERFGLFPGFRRPFFRAGEMGAGGGGGVRTSRVVESFPSERQIEIVRLSDEARYSAEEGKLGEAGRHLNNARMMLDANWDSVLLNDALYVAITCFRLKQEENGSNIISHILDDVQRESHLQRHTLFVFLTTAYLQIGKIEEAKRTAELIGENVEAVYLPTRISIKIDIAEALIKAGDRARAKDYLLANCAEDARRIPFPITQAEFLEQVAEGLVELGKKEEAKIILEEALGPIGLIWARPAEIVRKKITGLISLIAGPSSK